MYIKDQMVDIRYVFNAISARKKNVISMFLLNWTILISAISTVNNQSLMSWRFGLEFHHTQFESKNRLGSKIGSRKCEIQSLNLQIDLFHCFLNFKYQRQALKSVASLQVWFMLGLTKTIPWESFQIGVEVL